MPMAGDFDQVVDAVQAVGVARVLRVRFDADLHAAPLGDERRFLQRVFDQHEVLFLGGPLGLDAFVGVDDRHADLGGDADGQLDVFAVHVRPAQRAVRLQAGDRQPGLVAGVLDAIRIVEHRDGVEIARLAHQFAAEVDHRLEVFVAHLGRLLDGPLERFVQLRENSAFSPILIFAICRVPFVFLLMFLFYFFESGQSPAMASTVRSTSSWPPSGPTRLLWMTAL